MTTLDSDAIVEVAVGAPTNVEALDDGKKLCIGCDLRVSRTLFYKHSSAKDGLQSRCRGCDKKRTATPSAPPPKKLSDKPPYIGVTGGPLIYGYVR